jgi:hypothetical protein
VALVRVFVGNVLSVFGADQVEAEDVKVAVSDLVSALVEAGTPMEVEAEINGAQLTLTGNLAGPPPAAGALLLGSRLEVGEEQWTINLRTT